MNKFIQLNKKIIKCNKCKRLVEFRANQPTSISINDGLKLFNTYITAALKCVPPEDKPSQQELNTCFSYFKNEIYLLKNLKIIVALGKIAFDACFKFYQNIYMLKKSNYLFKHGAKYKMPDNKGYYFPVTFDLKDGSLAMVSCQDWRASTDIDDNFKISLYNSEFSEYLKAQN